MLSYHKVWDLRLRDEQAALLLKSPQFPQAVVPRLLTSKGRLPPATTHVVPLVKVHGAGDGGEALVAVVVVGVQSGGYATMTKLRERVRR